MNIRIHTPAGTKRTAPSVQGRDAGAPGAAAEAGQEQSSNLTGTIVNGPAAAAILSAGIGCFAVGLFALAGDAIHAIARFFTFYTPAGPLSGVTTTAIIVWLLSWFVLARQWQAKSVALGRVTAIAFVLLAASLLLTFPPFMDLLQGK